MKKVAKWQLHNENGKGMFKCKLNAPTKNSKNFKGTTSSGVAYDYHAFLSSEVSGKLVWIDHVKQKFGNKFIVALESEKNIHIIEMDVRSANLSSVVNPLLNSDYLNCFYNFSYAILEASDRDGKPIFNAKNERRLNKLLFLSENGNNIKGFYNAQNPKPEEVKWVKNLKGEWDDSAEIVFWTNHIVKIQADLVDSGNAIPFCNESFIFTQIENSFYNRIDTDRFKKGIELYRSKRPTFQFMYEKATVSNADSVFEEEEVAIPTTKESITDFQEVSDLIDDDLPF